MREGSTRAYWPKIARTGMRVENSVIPEWFQNIPAVKSPHSVRASGTPQTLSFVILGLVPRTQASAQTFPCCELDDRDKPDRDNVRIR